MGSLTSPQSCLIVGAGMSGLTAAEVLTTSGWDTVILEKGRGVGGRMATRHIAESCFDHGAQFFTVRDPRFRSAVTRWLESGWVKPWFTEGGYTRYCGVNGMNGLAKKLAADLDVRTGTTVIGAEPVNGGWRLRTAEGQEFQARSLLLTAPVPQSFALLAACAAALPAALTAPLNRVVYEPCFALLAVLDGPGMISAPGCVRPESGPIAFLADNTRKGISHGPAALTIHAGPEFTRTHFDDPHEEVARLLLAAARPWLGSDVVAWQVHRWKFAQPAALTEPYFFTDEPAPLAFAGDAFGGPRVEGAFLSGLAAGERFAVTLGSQG